VADYKKPDFWAQKAQKEGYPARSVYKLQEIDKKFQLLKAVSGKKSAILDLGAAPGSWSLWLLKQITGNSYLFACDLSPLSAKHAAQWSAANFHFFQGDLSSQAAKEGAAKLLTEQGFDPPKFSLIVSDAAPATSGNRFLDTSRSAALTNAVLDWGETMLERGGSLVCKFFQGEDSAALLERAAGLFKTARTFKPEACRDSSFETYLIGMKKNRTTEG
jgi:23S rRNA (uridine2552-2'-O)-methyltransferase